jgi:hypothetical protein
MQHSFVHHPCNLDDDPAFAFGLTTQPFVADHIL